MTDTPAPIPRFVRVVQVAEALSVGRATVYDWIGAGVIPARRVGRVLLVPVDDLLEALAEMPSVDADMGALAEQLLRFQLAQASDRAPDLCPRCTEHPISADSPFGWCAGCSTDRQIELDAAAEREKARKRRWWDANGKQWREGRRQNGNGSDE